MPLSPGASYLTAGGLSLEYRWWGPGPANGPVIVMLHEGLGCVALWRDVPGALVQATGLGVMAYSRAGYGQSDPAPLPRPLDYMTREALDVLPEVLERLGIVRPILLGHSDGATIAAIHAASHPVRAVAVIAPHFFTEPSGLAEIARAREAFQEGGLRSRLARHHADPDCAFRGWNEAWLDPGFRDWDVSGSIDGIDAPILAIQGEDDPYGTRAQINVIRRRARAPVEVLTVPDCGHAPHLTHAGVTLPAITAFIGTVSTGAAA